MDMNSLPTMMKPCRSLVLGVYKSAPHGFFGQQFYGFWMPAPIVHRAKTIFILDNDKLRIFKTRAELDIFLDMHADKCVCNVTEALRPYAVVLMGKDGAVIDEQVAFGIGMDL